MKLIEYQGFRQPIIVSNRSGLVVAGHGRLEAAKKLGLAEVPVAFQDFEDDEQEYAFGISDNAIASWAELDLSGINMDLPDFGPDLNLDNLGIKDFVLEPFDKGDSSGGVDYTKKIQVPIYEPKGENPLPKELYDLKKMKVLLEEIDKSKADDDTKTFLRFAAQRHLVFDYEKIAEFYAHASPEIQSLMEKSALVLIDFDKAIEYGFLEMTKEISEVYANETT